MPETVSLAQRIKAEFESRAQRKQTADQELAKEAKDREAGLAKFTKVCEELKSVWGPRVQEFAKQFGEKLKITPNVTPAQREAKINFLTDLANVTLTLSVAPSADATKLVLDYDLLIIPIYFDYERHARLEMPLDKIDKAAVGKWVDDQLISCLKAYLSIHDNEFYLRRAKKDAPTPEVKSPAKEPVRK